MESLSAARCRAGCRGSSPVCAAGGTGDDPHFVFCAPGVETFIVPQYAFLQWAVEWVCHTIAQADRLIAPSTALRPGETRVRPVHFLVLQPQQMKHG